MTRSERIFMTTDNFVEKYALELLKAVYQSWVDGGCPTFYSIGGTDELYKELQWEGEDLDKRFKTASRWLVNFGFAEFKSLGGGIQLTYEGNLLGSKDRLEQILHEIIDKT